MKRWEYFNKICGTEHSLDMQVKGILANKVQKQSNVCVVGLGKHIKAWLEEEVEEEL